MTTEDKKIYLEQRKEDFKGWEMVELRKMLTYDLPEEILDIIADSNISYKIMDQLLIAYLDGFSVEQLNSLKTNSEDVIGQKRLLMTLDLYRPHEYQSITDELNSLHETMINLEKKIELETKTVHGEHEKLSQQLKLFKNNNAENYTEKAAVSKLPFLFNRRKETNDFEKIITEGGLSAEQLEQVTLGIEHKLPVEQIKKYAKKDFEPKKMEQLRLFFEAKMKINTLEERDDEIEITKEKEESEISEEVFFPDSIDADDIMEEEKEEFEEE